MFHIPAAPSGRRWHRAVEDRPSGAQDILDLDEGPIIPVLQPSYVAACSLIVPVSEAERAPHGPEPNDPSGGDPPHGCPSHCSSPGNAGG